MRLRKYLSIAILALSLCGCTSKAREVMSEELYTSLESVIKGGAHKVALSLKDCGVEKPYEVYGNSLSVEDGVVTFDLLNDKLKLMTVTYDGVDVKKSFMTREEDKEVIVDMAKSLFGESVQCDIEDTYDGVTVNVKVQGVDYTWKNGVLELKQQ